MGASKVLNGWARSIRAEDPSFACKGFAFWIAFNLTAFSGSGWIGDIGQAGELAVYFAAPNLIACAVTLLAAAFNSEAAARMLSSNRALLGLTALASLGSSVLVSIQAGLFDPGEVIFLFVCTADILAGVGTTALFLRCAMHFGRLAPNRSLGMYAKSCLTACFVALIIEVAPSPISKGLFIALPVLGAIVASVEKPASAQGDRKPATKAPKPQSFGLMLVVMAFYALIAEMAKRSSLSDLPMSDPIAANTLAIIFLAAVSLVLLAFSYLGISKVSGNFSRLYALSLTAVMGAYMIASLVDIGEIPSAALMQATGLTLFLLSWCVYAYLVFQGGYQPVKVYGLGNAALTFGTLAGCLATEALKAAAVDDGALGAIRLILILFGFVCAFVVFPEHRIKELLVPITKEEVNRSSIGAVDEQVIESTLLEIAQEKGLSQRELQVLRLLASNRTPEEASNELFISIATTRTHIRNIYSKLAVHSRQELGRFLESEFVSRL